MFDCDLNTVENHHSLSHHYNHQSHYCYYYYYRQETNNNNKRTNNWFDCPKKNFFFGSFKNDRFWDVFFFIWFLFWFWKTNWIFIFFVITTTKIVHVWLSSSSFHWFFDLVIYREPKNFLQLFSSIQYYYHYEFNDKKKIPR